MTVLTEYDRYRLFVPAKSSGTVVTRAKPSGQAGNCAPLDNLDNATHARHNCRSRRPIVKTHPRTHNWAAWRAGQTRHVNEHDWQLLLLLTSSYYYQVAVVIINDRWLWHLCQVEAGARHRHLPRQTNLFSHSGWKFFSQKFYFWSLIFIKSNFSQKNLSLPMADVIAFFPLNFWMTVKYWVYKH